MATLKDRLLDSDETREVARVFIVEAMLADGGTPEDAAGLSHAALSACRAIIFADADRLIREAMEVRLPSAALFYLPSSLMVTSLMLFFTTRPLG